jgi:glycosyltransferase involved in cell wall biosynthesis
MPKVSIVITCYNLGEYLEEALSSALAQTYPDFEVLLVDDGSTDPATIALLDRLPAHPRLRVLRTANQRLARARNYGIAQAHGVYILPLDADDRILPTYLAHAARILDERPEVGFVGCHYRTFGQSQTEYTPGKFCLPDLLVENVVPITSVFRRACWEQINGYCLDLNGIEDWDLWIGILKHGYTGVVLRDIFFEYRIRPNSLMSQVRQPEIYQQRLAVLYERHRELFDRYTYDVLTGKDLQFARLHSYAMWLDQQVRSWEQVAQERLVLIETLDRRAAQIEQKRLWWRRQANRWQRIMAENDTLTGRMRALTQGMYRVAMRRLNIKSKQYNFRIVKRLRCSMRQTLDRWLIRKS